MQGTYKEIILERKWLLMYCSNLVVSENDYLRHCCGVSHSWLKRNRKGTEKYTERWLLLFKDDSLFLLWPNHNTIKIEVTQDHFIHYLHSYFVMPQFLMKMKGLECPFPTPRFPAVATVPVSASTTSDWIHNIMIRSYTTSISLTFLFNLYFH